MEKRVRFPGAGLPWLLLAPQLAVIGVFFYWPAVQAVWQSIFVQDAFGLSSEFVGLENFRAVLADPDYFQSLKISVVYAGLVTGIGLAASLAMAYFADRALRSALVFRTLLIWPYAVAPAVAGVLWLFLFNPSIGILAYWLGRLGLEWNHLVDSGQAMTLVVIAAVWKQFSYNFIFLLAGLQAIPKSMIEAAAIDGAGRWRTFRSIIVPLLSPTLFFLLVVNIVYAFFETFAIIDSVTSGGPGKATEILVYKVYADGFKGLDIGGSAAQSVILMVIVAALTFVQFRYVEKRVQYG